MPSRLPLKHRAGARGRTDKSNCDKETRCHQTERRARPAQWRATSSAEHGEATHLRPKHQQLQPLHTLYTRS